MQSTKHYQKTPLLQIYSIFTYISTSLVKHATIYESIGLGSSSGAAGAGGNDDYLYIIIFLGYIHNISNNAYT